MGEGGVVLWEGRRRSFALVLLWALTGCAAAPMSRVPVCWDEWSVTAAIEADEVFEFGPTGTGTCVSPGVWAATRRCALWDRLEYLSAYCSSVNAALGREPPEVPVPWWHGWLGLPWW